MHSYRQLTTLSRRLIRCSCAMTFSVGALLAGCAPPPMGVTTLAPVMAPINVRARAVDTLVYAGVDATQLVGSAVGAYYDGLAKVRQSTLYLGADDLRKFSETLRAVGQEELASVGYPVTVPSELFGSVQQYGNARFVLAGRVTQLELDTYGKLAGNYATLAMRVAWELFDGITRRVVLSTTGAAQATVHGDENAARPAFKSIMEQLLSDTAFVRAVTEPHAAVARAGDAQRAAALDAANSAAWPDPLPPATELITVRASDVHPSTQRRVFDRVADAVIVITTPDKSGSAFVITRTGLALTNNHVIEGTGPITATFRDGRTVPVRVVRTDSASDVALIELASCNECITVDWDDALPAVGTDVYAVGNPLNDGLVRSMTKGIVSGIRHVRAMNLIQTDAAVNPGNSGGPLVSAASGRIIGIVSSKLTGPAVEGLGFAISVSDALRILGVQRE